MDPRNSYPYPQYGPARQEQFIPKTAINELDSFMTGLTDEDRNEIFSNPDFGGHYSDFLNKFMFYLLQSEVGAGYINSSPARREMADRLKLIAHSIYSDNKKSQTSELEELRKSNEKLQKQLAKLSKGA